jgi:hypothetical protein
MRKKKALNERLAWLELIGNIKKHKEEEKEKS